MGAMTDKLKELSEDLDKLVMLSEEEKKKITRIVGAMKGLLDDNLELIFDMTRDEAYRYLNLLIQAFMQADANFIGGVTAPEPDTPIEIPLENIEPPLENANVEMPSFHGIFDQLPPDKQEKARQLLECVQGAETLEEEGRNPDVILCPECTLEKMQKCIDTADPAVKDDMDQAGLATKT